MMRWYSAVLEITDRLMEAKMEVDINKDNSILSR